MKVEALVRDFVTGDGAVAPGDNLPPETIQLLRPEFPQMNYGNVVPLSRTHHRAEITRRVTTFTVVLTFLLVSGGLFAILEAIFMCSAQLVPNFCR